MPRISDIFGSEKLSYEEFVKKAGSGKAYSDFIEMYDEIQPDAVFICVPPTCHGAIEFETIRRNIPF